ncbi:MAG TPA: hypothetical protein VMA72_26280, partial [Streptosporangiaceae bacterium]|nr:hypothetical protein [Streptosporangiaceae bacterium]
MTDPGWDIPGVPRDASPGPDVAESSAFCAPDPHGSVSSAAVSSAAGSRERRGRSGRQARAGSVSACSGLSAGAFAPLPDGRAPAADWPASSPGGASDGSSCASSPTATAATGIGLAAAANAAARDGSANAAARHGSANAAARHGSAVADSGQCGSTQYGGARPDGPGADGMAWPAAAAITSVAAESGLQGTGSPGATASNVSSGDRGAGCGPLLGTASASTPPFAASVDTGGCDGSFGSTGIVPAAAEDGAGSPGGRVTDPIQALAYLSEALDYLAHASPAEWAEGIQADCLRALAVAESQQTAAHAKVLQAFSVPGGGLAGDGHRSPRVWLTWQCAATRRAASSKVSWMHR